MDYKFIDEIPQNVFTNLQEIGSGTFSDIFSAIHSNTKTKVALKITLKKNNEEEMNSLEQEISINKLLNHPFICKYFTDIDTNHLKIIVMEHIDGINLLDYVNQTRGLPLGEVLNLFSQLVIAIEYLHTETHITHRDLKLENIMIDKYSHIRLIDFGFSSVNTMMTTCCGSIPYCAPEVLSGQNYTKKADIWSMGIILYALIDGNLPFYHPNINNLAAMICQKEVFFSSNFTDQSLQDLVQKMLIKDPEQRISIEDIKRHPSLSGQKLLQIDYKRLFYSYQYQIIIPSIQNLQNNSLVSKSSTYSVVDRRHSHVIDPKNFSLVNNEIVEDLDHSILKRKDFALNLNNLIESALIENPILGQSINLRYAISTSFVPHIADPRLIHGKRNSQHCVFKNKTPLLLPNVINHKFI